MVRVPAFVRTSAEQLAVHLMYIEAIGPDCQPLVLVGANDILTHLDEVPVQGLTSTRHASPPWPEPTRGRAIRILGDFL